MMVILTVLLSSSQQRLCVRKPCRVSQSISDGDCCTVGSMKTIDEVWRTVFMGDEQTIGREVYSPEMPGSLALDRFGFRALLGWHYLVLFAPLLVGIENTTSADLVLARQMILYASIAGAFLLIAILSNLREKQVTRLIASPPSIIAVCVIGAITSILVGFWPNALSAGYSVATAALGVSEAVLMFTWLHFFVTLAEHQPYKTLGADVFVGGVIAFGVSCLTVPANTVMTAVLPLIAATSLLIHHKRMDRAQRESSGIAEKVQESDDAAKSADAQGSVPEADKVFQEKKSSTFKERFVASLTAVAIFALVFGLMQGAYMSEGIVFFVASSQFALLGIVAAGISIYFVPERYCTHSDTGLMYRLSLLFVVIGVVLASVVIVAGSRGVPALLHQILIAVSNGAIIAGFNLFDFGNLAFSLGVVRRERRNFSNSINIGRAIVYGMLLLGASLGAACVLYALEGDRTVVLLGISYIAIIFLVATILIPRFSSQSLTNIVVDLVNSENQGIIDLPCELCGGSDTCEIRSLVAREIARREELGKTEQVLSGSSAASQSADSAVSNSTDAGYVEKNVGGGTIQSNSGGHEEDPADDKDILAKISKMYQLSKRESEVLTLISKGRNAQYVSKELVISIHTAKTHIANIYNKLNVHSSQELLDLIDEFGKGE